MPGYRRRTCSASSSSCAAAAAAAATAAAAQVLILAESLHRTASVFDGLRVQRYRQMKDEELRRRQVTSARVRMAGNTVQTLKLPALHTAVRCPRLLLLTVGVVLPTQGSPPWQGSDAASSGTRPGQQAKPSTFTGTQVQQQALTQDNRSLVVGAHSLSVDGKIWQVCASSPRALL